MRYDYLCNIMGEMSTNERDPEALLPKIVLLRSILD